MCKAGVQARISWAADHVVSRGFPGFDAEGAGANQCFGSVQFGVWGFDWSRKGAVVFRKLDGSDNQTRLAQMQTPRKETPRTSSRRTSHFESFGGGTAFNCKHLSYYELL